MRRRRRTAGTPRARLFERLEDRRLLVGNLQNPLNRLDVNDDGLVIAADVLLIVNHINQGGAGPVDEDAVGPPFYDVNGDDVIAPTDVLAVINGINRDMEPPEARAQLLLDTAPRGGNNEDRLTRDPRVTGSVTDALGIQTLTVHIDGGTPSRVDVNRDGSFTFDPVFATDGSDDGTHTFEFIATDPNQQVSTETLSIELDTLPPLPSLQDAAPVNSTASSVEIQFSELVDDAAFELDGYALSHDGQPLEIESVQRQGERVAQVTFGQRLPNGNLRLDVPSSVSDLAGNTVPSGSHVVFTAIGVTTVSEIAPSDGESLVSLTREVIVRFETPIDEETVDSESFHVISNGARVPGQVVVAGNQQFATFFHEQPFPPSTEIRVVVDGNQIHDQHGRALDADGDGRPGGVGGVEFRTASATRLENTNVGGFLLDAHRTDLSGNHLPIVGAMVTVEGMPEISAVTGADGAFLLERVPAPQFFVEFDASTSAAPPGFNYGHVRKPLHSVAGQTIQVGEDQGEPFDIYLPLIADSDAVPLVPDETGMINAGFGPNALEVLEGLFPDVERSVWDILNVEIEPNTLFFDDGSPADHVTVIPLAPERIPAPLPAGLDPSLVFTVDAGGATNVDGYARLTYPNIDQLPVGSQVGIFSFDHDAGRWIPTGNATVVNPTTIVSDEDAGIRTLGWRFPSPGGDGDGNSGGGGDGDDDDPRGGCSAAPFGIDGHSTLFFSQGDESRITITNSGSQRIHCSVEFTVMPQGVGAFATGAGQQRLVLSPGESENIDVVATVRTLRNPQVGGELLSGSIQVTGKSYETDESGNRVLSEVIDRTFYFSRLVTADGDSLKFTDAIVGEESPVELSVQLTGPSSAMPQLSVTSGNITISQSGSLAVLTAAGADDAQQGGSLSVVSPAQETYGSITVGSEIIDLSPLAIRRAGGRIAFTEQGFTSTGRLEFGLSADSPFAPLATFDGQLEVNQEVISGIGTFTTSLGPFSENEVFSGRFAIRRGTAKTDSLTDDVAESSGEIKVAGREIVLTSLAFVPGALEAEGRVIIEGDFLGLVKLDVGKAGQKIRIANDGVSIIGGKIQFPSGAARIAELIGLTARDVTVEFEKTPKARLRIQGVYEFSKPPFQLDQFANFKLDLSGDNFIEVSEDGITLIGRITVEDLVFVKDKWELKDLIIELDSTQRRLRVEGGLKTPVFESALVAGVEIEQGSFDAVKGGFSDAQIPIPRTPFVATKFTWEVGNLRQRDLANLDISGEIGIQLLKTIRFDNPLIGDKLPSLRLLTAEGIFKGTEKEDVLDGTVKIGTVDVEDLGGFSVVAGNAKLRTDKIKKIITAEGTFNVLGGFLAGAGKFTIDQGLNISGSLNGLVKIPNGIPVIGGFSLAGATGVLQIRNDGTSSSDFVAAWGTLFGKQIGVRLFFDGGFDVIGAEEIGPLAPSVRSAFVAARTASSRTFDIPSGIDDVLLQASWESPSPLSSLELRDPSGTVITEAMIADRVDIAIIEELSSETRRTVRITAPSPGPWTIAVVEPATTGELEFTSLGLVPGPAVALDRPTLDQEGVEVEVAFRVHNTAPNAVLQLYADSDRVGFDGQLLSELSVEEVVDPTGVGQVRLNLSELPVGDYGVYAVLFQPSSVPAFSNYSLGRIRAVDSTALDAVTEVQARWLGGDQVQLSWSPVSGADFYRISYRDDAARPGFQRHLFTNGPVNEFTITSDAVEGELRAGATYRIEVRAGTVDDRIGAPGGQAIAVIGATAAVPSEPGTFDVFADPGALYTATIDRTVGDQLTLVQAPAGATLDDASGRFRWEVPGDATGFSEVLIHRRRPDDRTDVVRFLLFSDTHRQGRIAGQKFADLDRDGLPDSDEQGVDGVTIELVDAITGEVLRSEVTRRLDANSDGVIDPSSEAGQFRFDSLTPGNYFIREVIDPARRELFSEVALSQLVEVSGGQAAQVNFGNPQSLGSVSGTVFVDADSDGVRLPGELGLADVRLFIDSNGNGVFDQGLERETRSRADDAATLDLDEAGAFTFDDLPPETYRILAEDLAEYLQTAPAEQAPHVVLLEPGAAVNDLDFGLAERTRFVAGAVLRPVRTDSGEPVEGTLSFGDAVVASEPLRIPLELFNLGDTDAVVASLEVRDSSQSFSVAGITAGATIRSGSSLGGAIPGMPFSIEFTTSTLGPVEGVLRIVFQDSTLTPFELRLEGQAISDGGELALDTINNNVGGAVVGSQRVAASFATITNVGSVDLAISRIVAVQDSDLSRSDLEVLGDGSAFRVSALTGVDQLSDPFLLGPMDSVQIDLAFFPSQSGLHRGRLLVFGGDQDSLLASSSIVGTGLATELPLPDAGDDFVVLEAISASAPRVLRALSNRSGDFQFLLPPSEQYHLTVFDPDTGLIGHSFGTTPRSGGTIDLTRTLLLGASAAPDSDSDGLPDDVEFALGTDLNQIDSDNDGIDDFAEIAQGLDPRQPFPSGIIAGVPLRGEAKQVVVEGAVDGSRSQTAFVATGSHGLAVVDVSRFAEAIVLGQLELTGDATDVAIDRRLAVAVVAANEGGLHLVDIADPLVPRRLRTIAANARHVEVFDGVAYAAVGTTLRAYNLVNGERIGMLNLGGSDLTGLTREGATLYTMDASRTLRAVDVSRLSMQALGAVTLSDGGGQIFAGNGTVYAPAATRFQGGFATADVSDPNQLRELSGSDVGRFAASNGAVAATGSGLAVAVGQRPTSSPQQPVLELFDVTNLEETFDFRDDQMLAGEPSGIALASGIAFVAAGTAGLQVVNYIDFDRGRSAPAVSFDLDAIDVDPVVAGIQVQEGSVVPLTVTVTDDVQVRNVELLVNGLVVQNDVSFPWEFSAPLPTIDAGGAVASVRVRATDTGGNTTISPPLLADLVPDRFAPTIVNMNPSDGSVVSRRFETVQVTFSEPIVSSLDPRSFPLSIASDPTNPILPVDLQLRNESRTLQLTFSGLAPGTYQLGLDSTNIRDRAGNSLDTTDATRSFTVVEADAVWIGTQDGEWRTANNWQGGRVPQPGDDVLISVDQDLAVTIRSGDEISIHSLTSDHPLHITGGSLSVDNTIQLNSTAVVTNLARINGGVISGAPIVLTQFGQLILDEVTVNNDLVLENGSDLRVRGDLTLNGAITLNSSGSFTEIEFDGSGVHQVRGSGEFIFAGTTDDNHIEIDFSVSLIIGEGITIRTAGGPGQAINIDRSNFGSSWSNLGVIDGRDAVVNLGSSFTTASVGRLLRNDRTRLNLTGTLDNTGAVLTIDPTASWSLTGGKIVGGVVEGAPLAFTAGSLDGVTLNTNLTGGTTLRLENDLLGNGQIAFGESTSSIAPVSFSSAYTIGPDIRVQLAADQQLTVSGTWSNRGVFDARSATIVLDGSFRTTDISPQRLMRDESSTIVFSGFLDNSNATLDLEPGPAWQAEFARFTGGTVAGSTLTVKSFQVLQLDGVTLDNDLALENGADAEVLGDLTLNGTITLNSTGSTTEVEFDGSEIHTLDGTGAIVFAGTSDDNHLDIQFSESLMIEAGITIRTAGAAGQVINIDRSGFGSRWANRAVIDGRDAVVNLGGHFATSSITASGLLRNDQTRVNLSGTLENTGSVWTIGSIGSWAVAGGQITGGVIDGDPLSFTTAALDGVTLNTNLNGGTTLRLKNDLLGNGQIEFGEAENALSAISFSDPYTIGPSIRIQLVADQQLTVSGTWNNQGVIDARDAAVVLEGNFRTADVLPDRILRDDGSTIIFNGRLDNTGATLHLEPGPTWQSQFAQLRGGEVSGSPLTVNAFQVLRLDGVTIDNAVVLENGADVEVLGNLTLNGTITLNSTGSTTEIEFDGSENHTLDGTGEIVFAGTTDDNHLDIQFSESLTIESGITIRTAGLPEQIINIDRFSPGSLWTNRGVIDGRNAVVNLGGNFATSSLATNRLLRDGNTQVNLTGKLNNTGSTLTIDSTASWSLAGGQITGGVVKGQRLTFTTASLDGVTLNTNLTGGSTLELENDLLGSGQIEFGGSRSFLSPISFSHPYSIGPAIRVRLTADQRLTVSGTWTNQGVVDARAATIVLAGSFRTADILPARLLRDQSSTIVLNGTLDNRDEVLQLESGPVWQAEFARLRGGSVSGAAWTVIPFGLVQLDGVRISNDLVLANGAEAEVSGDLSLDGSITLSSTGSLSEISFDGSESHVLRGEGQIVFAGTSNRNRVAVRSSETLTIESGVTIQGERGAIRSTQPLIHRGQVIAQGATSEIVFDVNDLRNEGQLRADAGGRITIDGNLTQGAAATVTVGLGGPQPSDTGRLEVNGNATLEGTLEILLVNNFTPAAGQSFQVVNFQSRGGSLFRVISGLNLGGLVLDPQYTATDLSLRL